MCCLIMLSLYDLSSENRSLHVKHGQCVFIHLVQGVKRDDIPALTDSRSEAFKYSRVQRI